MFLSVDLNVFIPFHREMDDQYDVFQYMNICIHTYLLLLDRKTERKTSLWTMTVSC
jgi:hypothetical protein